MKKKSRGVITVEAALLMPIILATLFLLYSLAIIQYNNIVTRSEAMRVANRVAINWNLIGSEKNNILTESVKPTVYQGETSSVVGKTGKHAISSDTYAEHDPYRFFVELFTVPSKKEDNIKKYLDRQMGTVAIANSGVTLSSEESIKSDSGIHLFNRYVSVTIENTYSSPMFQLLANMGFPQKSKYSITAKAKLTEPADFVRNVTFLQEIWRKSQLK